LGAQRAQDDVMRQSGAADQTVDFDSFGQTRGNSFRKLTEEAAEQKLFVGAEHAQTALRPQSEPLNRYGHRDYRRKVNGGLFVFRRTQACEPALSRAGQLQPRLQPPERGLTQCKVPAVKLGDVAHDGEPKPGARNGLVEPLAALHGA
jgi:hypothetical protein